MLLRLVDVKLDSDDELKLLLYQLVFLVNMIILQRLVRMVWITGALENHDTGMCRRGSRVH